MSLKRFLRWLPKFYGVQTSRGRLGNKTFRCHSAWYPRVVWHRRPGGESFQHSNSGSDPRLLRRQTAGAGPIEIAKQKGRTCARGLIFQKSEIYTTTGCLSWFLTRL